MIISMVPTFWNLRNIFIKKPFQIIEPQIPNNISGVRYAKSSEYLMKHPPDTIELSEKADAINR